MFKLLAFLLILCVLFGVETTRELFFGAVGFIFWAIVFLVGAGLLVTIFKDNKPDHEEEREKEPEPKKEPEHGPNDKYAYFLLAVFIIAVAIVFIAMANSPSQ